MTFSTYVLCGCVWGIFLVVCQGVELLVHRAMVKHGLLEKMPERDRILGALCMVGSAAAWPLGAVYWLVTAVAGWVVVDHEKRGIYSPWTRRAWVAVHWPRKVPHPQDVLCSDCAREERDE